MVEAESDGDKTQIISYQRALHGAGVRSQKNTDIILMSITSVLTSPSPGNIILDGWFVLFHTI